MNAGIFPAAAPSWRRGGVSRNESAFTGLRCAQKSKIVNFFGITDHKKDKYCKQNNTFFPERKARCSYKGAPLIFAPVIAVAMETPIIAQSVQSTSSSKSGITCITDSLVLCFLLSVFLLVSCENE